MKNALMPERHPNGNFFIADLFDAIPLKNDRHTMEHPFFTLSKKKDLRTIKYSHNDVNVVVSPSMEYGLPNMMDKDILLYLGSLVMAEVNKGNEPPKTIRFSIHDLMVTTNRETNGKGYMLVKNAFERLAGCLVTTNIKSNGREYIKGFHLLEDFEVIKSHRVKKRMVEAQATLPDWYYNALLGKETLTINRDYFRLRGTIERRLYEIARKHCGKQKTWSINFDDLHKKSGTVSALKKFREKLNGIIQKNNAEPYFPDYTFAIGKNNQGQEIVTFTPNLDFKTSLAKETAKKTKAAGRVPPIKNETIERAKSMTRKAGTGWDYYYLETEFKAQLAQGFKPDNVDGAFINFIKKKIKNRPDSFFPELGLPNLRCTD